MKKTLIASTMTLFISLPALAVWYTPSTISPTIDLEFRNNVEILSLAICIFLIGISLIDLLKNKNISNQNLRFLIFSAVGLLVLMISKLFY